MDESVGRKLVKSIRARLAENPIHNAYMTRVDTG